MNLPDELLDLCNTGYVTLGPTGSIVRFSTAKMFDQPKVGLIREGAEIVFSFDLSDDDEQNMEWAAVNMTNAMAAGEALAKAGFQVDIISGPMMSMMSKIVGGEPYVEPAAYISVWHDVTVATDHHALWDMLKELVEPWKGDVDEIGEIASGKAPHWHIMREGTYAKAAA